MSEKPISPLRRRMIEDMTVRNFVEKTRNDYIRHVRTFTAFLGRSPDTATAEDLRRFQLHQTQSGVRAPSINGSVAALRFFFTVTLDRPEMARHLTFVREPRKMPAVLSPEEVARLLEAAPGPKYKAALSAAYSAGLRVSEVVALKVSDIDSERLLLRIEQGKGRKDRFAMLSPKLRDWYRIARPAVWLFPVDSIWTEDVIIDEIFSLLYRSTYVICDFSGQNSNVFYEAGIAHTLGRTVIPIVQKSDHIPFDLRHRKYQLYKKDNEGLAELRTAVAGRLKTLIKNAK